jgi:diguanylate cyclase (GGDEF)-like protein/PAS domain S-box-containing protein
MDRDYIVAALRDGKASISRPVVGRRLQAPVFAMAVPIHDAQGKTIGVLVGVTELGKPNFLDNISQGNYGQTGSLMLVAAPYRLILAASDQRHILEELPASSFDPLTDPRVREHEGSSLYADPRGVEALHSASKVAVADWYVVVSLPTAEALAPLRAMQQRLLLATMGLTLLAGTLVWWLVRRQLSPMLVTVKVLATLSQSTQHPQPLPITRHDEIGKLIGGFNHLLSELGQRDALIKQVLNTSSVAIFLVDRQGIITQANQRMAEMFGRDIDGLVGYEYVALVNPAERDVARQKMLALLGSAIPAVDLDRLYWRANGTEFWGHLNGKQFIDANGEEHGLIGVIADISDRKATEEVLKLHDNRLTAIIENFPGGISMIDSDLRLVVHNAEFKRLLNFPDWLFEKSDLGLADIFRFNAQRGEYGPGDIEQQVSERVERSLRFQPHRFERVRPDGTVLEIHGESVPGGGFVTSYLDITHRKQMEEQVRQLAFYDALTHLPNRRLLLDRLSQALADSKRNGRYGALMFLDLDHFKMLNDTLGHAMGDLLLMQAASRMKACVREVDTVARLGGDEFVVMLADLTADEAESMAQVAGIAEKIRTTLAVPYPLTLKKTGAPDTTVTHACSASIGAVVFIDRAGSLDDFLGWADAAMYQAKEAGGNRVRFAQGKP